MVFLCADTDLISHLAEHHPTYAQDEYLTDLSGTALHDQMHVLDAERACREGTYGGHDHTATLR